MKYQYDKGVESEWVKGSVSTYAKKMLNEGYGYHRLPHFADNVVAFRRIKNGERPLHLEACTDSEIKELEDIRVRGQNLHSLPSA